MARAINQKDYCGMDLSEMNGKESFFDIFEFESANHDYIDCGIVYDFVKITKNIKFSTGELKIGDDYCQVSYSFDTGSFSFENFGPPSDKPDINLTEDSFVVTKEEMLPHLKW